MELQRTYLLSRRALMAGILAVCLSFPAINAQTRSEPATIEGVVVETQNGNPIPGVTLSIDALAVQPALNATSDSAGTFKLEKVPSGRVLVDASKDGYSRPRFWSSSLAPVTALPGQHLKGLTIQLTRNGSVAGRVRDSKGQPLANARIQLLRYSYASGQRQLNPVAAFSSAETMQTNDLGEFRIFDLPPDSYLIRIDPLVQRDILSVPAAQSSLMAILYPGTRDLEKATAVEIRPGEEVRLRDVTITPGPAGWIHVGATNNTGEPTPDFIGYSLQNENGAPFLFVQRGLGSVAPPTMDVRPEQLGIYVVSGGFRTPNGYFEGRAKVEYTGSEVNVNIIITKPEGRLMGRVVEESPNGAGSRPLADLQLIIPSAPMISTQTNGTFDVPGMYSGSYFLRRIRGLPAGAYLMSAYQGERDVLKDGVSISNGTATVEIVVRPDGGRISGKITDNQGRMALNATAVLVPEPELLRNRSDLTINFPSSAVDQLGVFEISGVIPGDYRMYAWSDIERGVWMDPEFLSKLKERGSAVHVDKGSTQYIDLKILN